MTRQDTCRRFSAVATVNPVTTVGTRSRTEPSHSAEQASRRMITAQSWWTTRGLMVSTATDLGKTITLFRCGLQKCGQRRHALGTAEREKIVAGLDYQMTGRRKNLLTIRLPHTQQHDP